MLIYGSLFAGIGGFDLGLERAGWRCAWQVESDPACRSVLRRHFPGVPIYEDVREVGSDLEPVDLVCGGFPCQDISVAGKRAGLAGARSGLWWEFHRILAALAPRWVLIENVAGLLSSNGGRDLGAIFGGLADLGYVGSWRVLDSQHFAVAQRRRRVFIVGHLGTEPRPEVLSLAEGVSGHPPPSREAGARVAATLTRGAESQGRGGYAGRRQEDDVNVVAALGSAGGEGRGWRLGADEAAGGQVVAALRASNGGPDDNRAQAGHVVVGALQSHAARHGHAMTTQQAAESGHVVVDSLTASFAKHHGASAGKDSMPRNLILAFSVNQRREGRLSDVHGALHEPSGTQLDGVLDPMFVHPRILRNSLSSNQVGIKDDGLSDALTSEGPGAVMQAIPRRLTPMECERLQGFPDRWTAWGLTEDGERVELSDSARYRQLGNAVTVTVSRWIGERILAAARASAGDAGADTEATE